MSDGNIDLAAEARAQAYALPLDQLNPGDPALFRTDAHWPILERLRKEDPVHYTAESEYGPYWSITKYNDIMAVDTNHEVFSSEGGITIASQEGEEGPLPMFIAMDPPKHDVQRKTVSPAVAPANLAILGPLIRERAAKILDGLERLRIPAFVVGPAPSRDPATTAGVRELSGAFEDVCARRRIPYVDTVGGLVGHDQWESDLARSAGDHPGQTGYGLIAWLVLHSGFGSWLGTSR